MNTVKQLKRNNGGFTLIELLIVAAVVAILTMVAYPAYQDHLVKTYRSAAKGCMLEYSQYMERYYATNLSYLVASGALPVLGCARESGLDKRYNLVVTSNVSTYLVTVAPLGMQLRDQVCGTMTLNHLGEKTPLTDCW